MKPKHIYIFFSFIILFLLILVNYKKEDTLEYKTNTSTFETEQTIKVDKDSNLFEINIDEYLIGVIGCEMPALFEEEALKAGTVAARTYILNKLENDPNYIISSTTNDQCYNTEEELKEKWDNDYDKYFAKIKKIIEETQGEYMTYNNEIIKAFYFSTSNGKTENVENVFGEQLDYLVSVDSQYDKNTSQYKRTIQLTKDEFLNKLNLPKNNNIEITNIIRNESERIDEITINNQKFKGTNIRKLLDLRSTDFEIKIDENNVTITTKGYGHGVGMSQYGANELAKIGYNYEEILKHYYSGIELKNKWINKKKLFTLISRRVKQWLKQKKW